MRPAVALLLFALAACTGARSAAPLPADLGPRTDADVQGEKLYRTHCAACHRLLSPTEETKKEWAAAVEEHREEAHLSREEAQLVLDYLVRRAP